MLPQKRRPASRLRIAAGFIVLVVASALAASCTNDARDSHCDAETPDEGDCISNPDGLGPQVKESRCALPAAGEEIIDHAPDFGEILAFMEDPKRGNCIATGCHGFESTASVAIFFPQRSLGSLEACGTYKTLTTTSGSVGTPYVVENIDNGEGDTTNEALQSWMYCNVLGLGGGGFPMPKPGGVPVQADAVLIHDWIVAGAHGPGGCPEAGGT